MARIPESEIERLKNEVSVERSSDWVIKKSGVSFRHAVELLRDDSALAACSGNRAAWTIPT